MYLNQIYFGKLARPNLIALLTLLICISCKTEQDRAPLKMELVPVPPSLVNIAIKLPVSDLATGLNAKLSTELINGGFSIGKQQQDSLFLTIVRTRKVDLAFRNNSLYVSMPVRVTAYAKKRVMGLKFSNEGSPVTFDAVAQLQTKIKFLDDWNLDFSCKWKGLIWESEPTLNVMGMSFNLEKLIEEKLKEFQPKLENEICHALNKKISFRDLLNNVYQKLPEPKPIAKKVGPLYLHFLPSEIRGSWNGSLMDTIALQVESEMNVSISSQPIFPVGTFELQKRKPVLNKKSGISSYIEVLLGMKDLEQLASAQFLGHRFTYEGYSADLAQVNVFTRDQKLCVRAKFTGDLKGSVVVSGKPILDKNRQLTFDQMTYELEEADQWIKLTNMAVQSSLETYLNGIIKVDVAPFFGSLTERIRHGIEISPLGAKIGLNLDFETIELVDQGMDEKSIQFIFLVNGSGEMMLKKGLFD